MCFSSNTHANDKIHPVIKVDMIALQFYWRGEMLKALNRLDYSLAKNPNQPQAWNVKGAIRFYSLSNFKTAIKDFTKAIELDPEFVFPYTNRGWLYLLTDDYCLAKRDFQAHLKLEPDNPFGYYKMGVLSYYRGKFRESIDYFSKSLLKDPSYDFSATFKYFALKANNEDGEKWLRTFLSTNPKTSAENEIKLYLGELLPAKYLEAVKETCASKPRAYLDSKKCAAHFDLGKYFRMRGDDKMALKHFYKSINMKNCDVNLKRLLAKKEMQSIQ